MSLVRPVGVTVSLPASSQVGTFTGDMSALNIQPGMELFIGSRAGRMGDGRIMTSFTLNGGAGANFQLEAPLSGSAITDQPFVIDNFAAPLSIAAQNNLWITNLVNALRRATGLSTTLDQASKTWQMDRAAGAGTFSQWLFSLAARTWFAFEQRTVSGVERLFVRSYPDGTSPVDSIDIDGATGGGKMLSAEGSIASAATTDLSVPRTDRVLVTGANAITSFGSAKWQKVTVRFADALVLTHNATSLALPGGANIATAAGDTAVCASDGSGNWRVLSYARANGTAVGLGPTSDVRFNSLRLPGTADTPYTNLSAAGLAMRYGDGIYISPENEPAWPNGSILLLKTQFDGGTDVVKYYVPGGQRKQPVLTMRAGDGSVVPGVDNTQSLGSAASRWSNVYAVGGAFDGNVAIGTASVEKLSVGGVVASQVAGGTPASQRGFRQYIDGSMYLSLYHDNSRIVLGENLSQPRLFANSVTVSPGADNVQSSGTAGLRWSNLYASQVTVDANFRLGLLGNNPTTFYDGDAAYHYYDRTYTAYVWRLQNAAKLVLGADSLVPGSDNAQSLGIPSQRWSTIYSGTGSINTSDQKQKTPRRDFTDAELDAWGEVKGGVFQFLDSVEAKGVDHARLHFGYIAQDVEAAFRAHDVDPARCALWCADPETRRVSKTRRVTRQATEKVTVKVTEVVVEDGRPVQKLVERTETRPAVRMVEVRDEAGAVVTQMIGRVDDEGNPVMRQVPVLDENGEPVMNFVPALDEDGKPAMKVVPVVGDDGEPMMDAEGKPVTREEGVLREEPMMRGEQEMEETPVLHAVPVIEEVEEAYEEDEPTGETRLGLRYDQCAVIEAAWQRRRGDRLEETLANLSARVDLIADVVSSR